MRSVSGKLGIAGEHTVPQMVVLVAALAFAGLVLMGCSDEQTVTQGAAGDGQTRILDTVTVSGQGSTFSSPDEALLYVAVETTGQEAAEAVDENARRMEAVIARLQEEGVAEDEIETSNVTVYPESTRDPESGELRTERYRATNTVQVTLTDLERVGEIYSAAVESGANNVRGPEWRLSNDSVAVQEALKRAAAAARGKAQALAEAEGASVGDVLVMQEDSASTPPIYFEETADASMERSDVATVPVSPQDLEVTASVTITYRLDR